MRTIFKFLLASLILIGTSLSGFSQKGVEDGSRFGHGKDSIRCLKNLSLYAEFYKQKNYEDAVKPWTIVYQECPLASKNIYIHGENMITDAIENAEDEAKKAKLVDSLMNLYDKRIKYFDQKGFVLGKKGTDYVLYSDKTIEDFQKAYDMLSKSIELQQNNSKVAVLVVFMQTSRTLFSNDVLEGDKVVENYARVLDILNANLEQNPNNSLYERGLKAVNQVFEASGAATCENLNSLFKPKFAENPKDEDLLKRITSLFDKQGCTDAKLYADAAVNLNEIDPSAESAHHLAKLFYSKEKYDKSVEYYEQAIELQDDKKEKASYYLQLADLTFSKLGNKSLARSYARKSLENNPDNGKPYILIGRMYAESLNECGGDEFEKKAVLWAAVDKFIQAKNADPSIADEANGYINSYQPRFPDKKTIFFQNYQIGDTYKIGCWINETTTVREP